jgi:hypothetical protein
VSNVFVGPQNKIIKAQFNSFCTAALVCEMNNIVLTAGSRNKTNLIEVSDNGIYIQPSSGQSITLGSYSIKGPLHYENPIIFNRMLPGVTQAPSAFFNLDMLKKGVQIGTALGSLGVIL